MASTLTDKQKSQRKEKKLNTQRLKTAKDSPKAGSLMGLLGAGTAMTSGLPISGPVFLASPLIGVGVGGAMGIAAGAKIYHIQKQRDRKEISQREAGKRTSKASTQLMIGSITAGVAAPLMTKAYHMSYPYTDSGGIRRLKTKTIIDPYSIGRGSVFAKKQYVKGYNKVYKWSEGVAEKRNDPTWMNTARWDAHSAQQGPLRVTNFADGIRASRSTSLALHSPATIRSIRSGVKIGAGVAGAAALGYGGYQVYHHRDDIKQKFHETRARLGAR